MNEADEHLNQLIGALKNVNKFSLFRDVRLKLHAFLVIRSLNASIDSHRKQYNYENDTISRHFFQVELKCVMCN
jgi:hypothetical protein